MTDRLERLVDEMCRRLAGEPVITIDLVGDIGLDPLLSIRPSHPSRCNPVMQTRALLPVPEKPLSKRAQRRLRGKSRALATKETDQHG